MVRFEQTNGIKDFMSHENKLLKMFTWFHCVAQNSIEGNEVESVGPFRPGEEQG